MFRRRPTHLASPTAKHSHNKVTLTNNELILKWSLLSVYWENPDEEGASTGELNTRISQWLLLLFWLILHLLLHETNELGLLRMSQHVLLGFMTLFQASLELLRFGAEDKIKTNKLMKTKMCTSFHLLVDSKERKYRFKYEPIISEVFRNSRHSFLWYSHTHCF